MWDNINTSMSQADGFLNESISQIGENKIKINRTERLDTITPMMIGHIINTTKKQAEKLSFYGLPVRIFTIMGIVRHIEHSTTKVTFEIEDETGTMTAIKQLEANRELAELSVEINTYVRVYGMIRNHDNKQDILVLSIVSIKDLDELTNHLLEVTYVILQAKEMTKTKVDTKEEDDAYSDLTPDQLKIYKIILAENDSNCGIERSMVMARAPANLKSRTNKLLQFLIDSGHIYTTLTNDHFKTT